MLPVCAVMASSARGERGLLSSCRARASHYGGFSCCGNTGSPGPRASVAEAHSLSSCVPPGSRAQAQ